MPRAGLHCSALDAPLAPLRVAVSFFGLVRRIEHTLGGLEANLLVPLRSAAAVDVFVHAMLSQRVTSSNRFHAYASELNTSLNEADFLALRPCRFAAEDQRVVDLDHGLRDRARMAYTWRKANHRRLKLKTYSEAMLLNVYRAYYSLRQVNKLLSVQESKRKQYTHVVAARPDCTILAPPFIWSVPPTDTIIVPNFAHNSGVNDRFAFGAREAMGIYMQRFDWLVHSRRASGVGAAAEDVTMGALHSRRLVGTIYGDALGNATETEDLVCRYLAASHLRVGVMPLCVVRVRATGVAVSEALNKSKSPLGLPTLCHHGLEQRGARGAMARLEMVRSSRDLEMPCPDALREISADGVTTFRAEAWAATTVQL